MKSIDHFNLRSFDLNLLIAFDALMQERSVTLAAKRLKIQQPAMSHTLATLRLLFDDELFVRVKQIMEPTYRAAELHGPIREVLAHAQDVLRLGQAFDPRRDVRHFRIGMTNGIEVLLLPELAAKMRDIAPQITLVARAVDPAEAGDLLDAGELDLVVGCYARPSLWQRSELLFEEGLACCYNPERLRCQNPIGTQTYLDLPHAVVSLNGDLWGCLRAGLEEIGAQLNIVASGPNFLSALMMAREGALLATLPTRIATAYAPLFGLQVSPVPLPFSANPITMVWPIRSDKEPGSAWLRQQIRAANFVVGPGAD